MEKVRKEQGLTQQDLAQKLGVKKLQVHNYETGKAGIDLSLAERLAEELRVPLEILLFPEVNPESAELIAWIKEASPDLVRTLKGICIPVIRAHARSNSR